MIIKMRNTKQLFSPCETHETHDIGIQSLVGEPDHLGELHANERIILKRVWIVRIWFRLRTTGKII
jgi:hypothetical protein